MDVQVKHNGVDITSYVIEYHREHKICTGIGLMEITIARTVGRTFEPWDTISIYENGDFKVDYHVSVVVKSVPDATITLECQDGSKRLVDYFIPDSYVIETPTLTRYWIEKFLAEAGISYQFTTSSQGVLLSNYTNLGLVPAYEQILQLLQMSGWYMYFDGNGTAIIGSLMTELPDAAQSYGETDILSISVITDDKMLRNRAVVWGAYDILRGQNAFADVRTQTRWNYDSNDLRAMVVSNSNIPTRSSAYGIANTLIKEFARITIEKHLTVAGASNINLGDVARVRSRAWNGSGLVTTFGVSMSKQGLITSLILDERCPRLFGFFDFGDYVYVGTFGSGVWRKRIKYDPTWYNFSTGLPAEDLAVTDLHINYDMFGCVTASGHGYYATSSDGPWIPYPMDYLSSSLESNVELVSGVVPSGLAMATFSGIMTRCVIVDKVTGAVKYGVDTYSGQNWGDYFMMWSGFILNSGVASSGLEISSGVSTSGGYRGWIVEYNPITSISGVYPISISGNFNMMVVDIENDGINDYVSVRTTGSGFMAHTALGYDFGSLSDHSSSMSVYGTEDPDTRVSFAPIHLFDEDGKSFSESITTAAGRVSVFNNESIGEQEIVYEQSGTIRRRKLTKTGGTISSSSLTSPTFTVVGKSCKMIKKVGTDLYNIILEGGSGSPGGTYTYSYKQWNAATNLVSSESTIYSYTRANDPYHEGTQEESYFGGEATINGVIYKYELRVVSRDVHVSVGDPEWDLKANNYVEIYRYTIDTESLSGSGGLVFSQLFETAEEGLANVKRWEISPPITFDRLAVLTRGGVPTVIAIIQEFSNPTGFADYIKRNYLIYSSTGSSFSSQMIQSTTSSSDTSFLYQCSLNDSNGNPKSAWFQLTSRGGVWYALDNTNSTAFLFNGESFSITSLSTVPWQMVKANIYPMYGAQDTHYIAKNGSNWYFVNDQTLAAESLMTFPFGFTVDKPFSTTDSISPRYYWHGTDASANRVIMRGTQEAILEVCRPTDFSAFGALRGFICGNFFVDYGAEFFEGAGLGGELRYLYLNNDTNVPNTVTKYLVLQREQTSFNLIQESFSPIRLDISNNAPVFTVLDRENTFKSHYITDSELLTVSTLFPVGPVPSGVRDYRYTMLELPSGIMASGMQEELSANKIGLYLVGSGILFTDVSTLNSGFTMLYSIPSGLAERIETSNFVGSGQYIFVTTSGDFPTFFQKDPADPFFVEYSGLPSVRATIIRVDDRF